jgi:cellulose synthase operon protein YhjQ
MKRVVFQGLRGGTGTTSTVAAIGDALQSLDESVLLIDLAPTNLLSLHFGISPQDPRGWARTSVDGGSWYETTFEVKPGLHLLPFGLLSEAERRHVFGSSQFLAAAGPKELAGLTNQYSFILIDLSSSATAMKSWTAGCDLQIMTAEADPASCALLFKLPRDARRRYLITRYDPISRIQRDIRLLWQAQLGSSLLPQVMHRDASMIEALGYRQAVGSYRPNSLAAQDAMDIAVWCQRHIEARA